MNYRAMKEFRVLANLQFISTSEELVEVVHDRTGQRLDQSVAKRIIDEKSRRGYFESYEQLTAISGGDGNELRGLERALGSESPESFAEVLGAVSIPSSRISPRQDGQGVSASAFRVPTSKGTLEVPVKAPPAPAIPDGVSWRVGDSTPGASSERDLGGCRYRRVMRSYFMHGPIQSQEEHLWDIVIVESTGSATGTFTGVSLASAGVSTPSYHVVLVQVCLLHRWRLEKIRRIHRHTRRCPPKFDEEVLIDETREYGHEWVQLDPVFPYPCGRTVLFTFGGSGDDPFRKAQAQADRYAQANGLPRGEGDLQDRPG